MTASLRNAKVWLLIASLCLAFGAVAAGASFQKAIPPDEVNPKLETVLQELARTAQTRPAAVSQIAGARGIPMTGKTVTVIVEPVFGRVSSIDMAAVAALGGVVEETSKSLMRVRVPVDKLEALADRVAGVAFIRLPYHPRPLAITSEGVALTGADDFHTAGYYGQGVKVAIIDLGFNGLTAAQNAGELVNVVYTRDYTGTGLESGTKHGTGVAEIVEDMAPQAELYLLKIDDSVDLENAVDYCINNGIDIINHSVGWYNTNFYDGTGVVAGIANNARNNGILWVNAAGNEASDGHWQGAFVDSDGDGYLDFGSGADYLDGDTIEEGNRIYASTGDTIYIYMTWDDWSASDQDYDLYLYDSSGAVVASSTNYQSGTQAPTEEISYAVPTSGYYDIVIQNYNAPAAPDIEFFAFTESGANLNLEHHQPESSIVTPANSAKVLAVGAIYRGNWTSGPQEYFSSQGPSNASKYAASITKPDICGPDGVSNYTYSSGFYGTSAASPHVAGAAALLLSEDPTLTADQLQAKLEGDAIDMGVAGKDNLYGSGRLNLVLTPTQDLVGYWEFNEGSGSVAGDSSGLGNDGTIYGASWVSSSPDGSTALSFDGMDDYVEVPDDTSLDITDAITIEAWIRPATTFSTGNFYVIVSKYYNKSGYQFVWHRDGYLYFYVTDGIAVRSTVTTLNAGRWYHVAVTYQGGTSSGEIYLDGTDVTYSSSARSFTTNGYDLAIGAVAKSHICPFRGDIDEVRIHNRVLDPSEFNLLPAGSETASAKEAGAKIDQILAIPNPITSAPGLFKVKGEGISSVRLDVYDLSGQQVFSSSWVSGNEVEWNLRNKHGEIVANGVYLYILYVKGTEGQEKSSGVNVVAILR